MKKPGPNGKEVNTMNCPYCGIPMMDLDHIDKERYRVWCPDCQKTFCMLSCPECKNPLLEIVEQAKFLCANRDCPTHGMKYFTLTENLSHLKEFFIPYAPPPQEPKAAMVFDLARLGPFTVYKVGRSETELDIVFELPPHAKNPSEFAYRWDQEDATLTIERAHPQTPFREDVPLEELREKKILEIHRKKSTSWYFVITFVFE